VVSANERKSNTDEEQITGEDIRGRAAGEEPDADDADEFDTEDDLNEDEEVEEG
jgi:hypothetical protein